MSVQDPRPSGSGVLTVPGEPVTALWRPQRWDALAVELLSHGPAVSTRPVLIAVDGRSGSGKTTVAARLAAQVPGSVVVHTDDVAWWESFFGWDHLLAAGVLVPLRQGGAVAYRPPAWEDKDREGAIEVPAGCPLVIVEGVGAARAGLASLVDATIWVQADVDEATRRGLAREGGTPEAVAFWQEWQGEERPFLLADRPWDRASVILCGTPELVPGSQWVQGSPPLGDRVLRAVSRDEGPIHCRC